MKKQGRAVRRIAVLGYISTQRKPGMQRCIETILTKAKGRNIGGTGEFQWNTGKFLQIHAGDDLNLLERSHQALSNHPV
jgi:hypothetical protein